MVGVNVTMVDFTSRVSIHSTNAMANMTPIRKIPTCYTARFIFLLAYNPDKRGNIKSYKIKNIIANFEYILTHLGI